MLDLQRVVHNIRRSDFVLKIQIVCSCGYITVTEPLLNRFHLYAMRKKQ